jgi:hypothetical protein
MFFAVFEPCMTSQVHESIFSQKNAASTGKVCTTSVLDSKPPVFKGKSPPGSPKIVVFDDE